jgi:hypothetical protein
MSSRSRLSLLVVLALAGAVGALPPLQGPEPAGGKRLKAGKLELSGPHTHDNLTVYLVHGEDQLKGRKYLMLADALAQKKFVIYETQKVNDLTMENLSDTDVVILAGDILKGGQQDRIAQYDQIVPPKSGKVPLRVFCVERSASRWMKPLTEQDKTFHASPGQICTNDLRLACRKEASQGKVWKDVKAAQAKLSMNANVDARKTESADSLPLSLQVKEVQENIDKYVARLNKLVDGKSDVVGFVFAINGKVQGYDVYGSPAIFQKVWARLLRASATEAFTELKKGKAFPAAGPDAVRAFLEAADKGKVTGQDAARGMRQITNEADRVLRFETGAGKASPAAPPGSTPPALRKSAFTY